MSADTKTAGKHLWEVEHEYYCNEGNYYASESVEASYRSFADFLAEEGDSDMDYNLLFRWDWKEGGDEDSIAFNGDEHYRNGTLILFWMGQRKGLYRFSTVSVCRADEPAVLAFLGPRWEHLRKLWAPLTTSEDHP